MNHPGRNEISYYSVISVIMMIRLLTLIFMLLMSDVQIDCGFFVSGSFQQCHSMLELI